MTADDSFVLKKILAVDEIVQVHVTIFVDEVFAVIGGKECHLGDENFGTKHIGVTIESGRGGISGVSDKRDSSFRSDFNTREPSITDLVTGPIGELRFEFSSFFPNDKSQRGNRMLHRMSRHEKFSG